MPVIEISVRENVIPRTSAIWEISFEYAGKPPVAKPTTRPEATIVGNERHGRNTAAGDGPPLKSLPHQSVARKAPTMARAIANFCGKVSRSSIQNRHTRIAQSIGASQALPTAASPGWSCSPRTTAPINRKAIATICTGTSETPRMTTAAATVMTGYAAVNPLTTLAVPDSIARNQKIVPKHPQTALAVANATPSGVKRSQPDPRTNQAA